MTPAPKRRWSYSLRTLFVVVILFGFWLGWNVSKIRQREAILHDSDFRFVQNDHTGSIPLLWRILGEDEITLLDVPERRAIELVGIQALFTEASVRIAGR